MVVQGSTEGNTRTKFRWNENGDIAFEVLNEYWVHSHITTECSKQRRSKKYIYTGLGVSLPCQRQPSSFSALHDPSNHLHFFSTGSRSEI